MPHLASDADLPRWHPPLSVLEFAELVLTGVLARMPIGLAQPPQPGPVVLEDAEGTPVAVWNPDVDDVRALRPFAHGPLRSARTTPQQLHARWSELGVVHGRGVLGVPLTGSLSGDAVEAIQAQAAGRPILWVAMVDEGRIRDLPPVALWRSAQVLARDSGVAVPLALPLAPPETLDQELISSALKALGVTEIWPEQPVASQPGTIHPVFEQEWQRVASPGRFPGATVFFTGLSGSGKSTIAKALAERISEGDGADFGGRTVSLLDGDEVRRLLSAGLGFSRADRDLNILRIGFVATEITRHGGLAICAPIAPFDVTRQQVRERVSAVGDFLLIHVNTPLAECERRDRKGLYAKARAGQIPEFTGISSPYEEPGDADLRLDTSTMSLDDAVAQALSLVQERGLLSLS